MKIVSGSRMSHFSLNKAPRQGHVRGIDSDVLEAAFDANTTIRVRELSGHISISHMTADCEMKRLEKVLTLTSCFNISAEILKNENVDYYIPVNFKYDF